MDASLSEIRNVLRQVRDTPFDSMDGARSRYEGLTTSLGPGDGVAVERVRDGAVSGEWITARSTRPENVIFHLHGGGFMVGSPTSHRVLAGDLSRRTQARVFVLDYRLSPEHPFPAAHRDAIAAYKWLLEAQISPGNLSVVGDSAGGGLAVSTLAQLSPAGLPQPASCVVVGPMCDLETKGASHRQNLNTEPWATADSHASVIEGFLQGADPRDPIANPLYAQLDSLPPTLIQVADNEMLFDDSVTLASRLRDFGVETTLDVWSDVVHDWHLFAPIFAPGRRALDKVARFIKSCWG